MILIVAIIAIGFTWRLIRRAIIQCLYLVLKLTGLTRLYDHLRAKRQRRREAVMGRVAGGGRDRPESSACYWPISLAFPGPPQASVEVNAHAHHHHHHHDNDDKDHAQATRGPTERGQLRRRSSIGRSLVLPMAANWCAGLGSSSGGRALLRSSGNFLLRGCVGLGGSNTKTKGDRHFLNYDPRQGHLHLA